MTIVRVLMLISIGFFLFSCQGGAGESFLSNSLNGNKLSLKASESTLSADEGDLIKVILLLGKATPETLKINWELISGAEDFESSSGEFEILADQSSGLLELEPLSDDNIEGDETYRVKVWSEQLANTLEFDLLIRDKTSPAPVIEIGKPSSGSVNASVSLSFPVTVNGASSVDIKDTDVILSGDIAGCAPFVLNGTTDSPVIEVRGCNLPSGAIEVSIASGVARDSKGNLNRRTTAADTIKVDNLVPNTPGTWALESPLANSLSKNINPVISVSGLSDAIDGVVKVFNDSACTQQIGSGIIDVDGQVLINSTLDSEGSDDGVNSFFAQVSDQAGNISDNGCQDLALSYTLDTQAPVITIGSPSPAAISSSDTAVFQIAYAGATSVSLSSSDITLSGDTSNCSKTLVQNTSSQFELRISGCDYIFGSLLFDVAAGTASDAAGNISLGLTSSNLVLDNTSQVVLTPNDFSDVGNATHDTDYTETFTLSGFSGSIEIIPSGQLALSSDNTSFSGAILTLNAGESFYARMTSGVSDGQTSSGNFSMNHSGGSFRSIDWEISTPAVCSGKMVGGYCWLQTTNSSQSCVDRCSSFGGVHPATRSYAGNYGSMNQCIDILTAFGARISSGMEYDYAKSAGCYHGNTNWGGIGGAFTDFTKGVNSGGGSRGYCACNSGSAPPASPADPLNLAAAGINSTSIALQWEHPANSSNARYKIAFQAGAVAPADCQTAQEDGSEALGSSETNIIYLVDGLSPNTQYSFRVCASNDHSSEVISAGKTVSLTTKTVQSTNIALVSAAGFSPNSGQTVLTESITVSGANPYLLVNTAERGTPADDIVSIEFDGVPLTKISSLKGSWVTQDVWYLANPPQTTGNIVITKSSGTSYFDFTTAVYENVDPTTPHIVLDNKTFESAQYQAMAGNYNSNPGSLIVAAFSYYDYYGLTVKAPLTLDHQFRGYIFHGLKLYSVPGDSSVYMMGGFSPYGGYVTLSLQPVP